MKGGAGCSLQVIESGQVERVVEGWYWRRWKVSRVDLVAGECGFRGADHLSLIPFDASFYLLNAAKGLVIIGFGKVLG